MAEVVVKENGIEGVELFGEVDKVNGKVGSEYPVWYFEPHTQEIREEVTKLEHRLKNGLVVEKGKPAAQAELAKHKEKLDKIDSSRPVLSGRQKDEINKATEDLGQKIREGKFSTSDEKRGLVDPHEVVERMMKPCIKLNESQIAMAHKMGCRISNDGKVSGNDADRVWKTYRRLIGESTNTESLRRV
jgi:hypothetical protein